MSTYNLRNSSKRKNHRNRIDKTQSNEKPKHNQQSQEKRTKKKNLAQVKCSNCDQMGHDQIKPERVLSNIYYQLLCS